MSEKYLCFGGQTLAVRYPQQAGAVIDFCFVDYAQGCTDNASTFLDVIYDERKKLFSVKEGSKIIGSDLDQGDLALLLLTRSTYSLVHEISGGSVVHGAAVQRNGNAVLIPGNSSIGKSLLTAWLLSRGSGYLTDELVYFPENTDCFDTLVRPLHIRQSGLPIVEEFCQFQKRQNLILQGNCGTLFSHRIFNDQPIQPAPQLSLLLFIEYNQNGPLSLDGITPAQAAQRLMGCLANGRNLKMHGFSQVAALARQVPALTLQYGNFDQFDKAVTPILDFVLDTRCNPSSLAGFIRAFHRLSTKSTAAVATIKKPAPAFPLQKATPLKKRRKLTIGMATYDDYDGVYFSTQALRMYHPEITADSEILVIDNHPDGACAESLKKLDESVEGYRYLPVQGVTGTAVRDFIFQHAAGELVLCMDCHVFVIPGAIKKLLAYFDANRNCRDLLQGPMIHDDLKKLSTHFEPIWRKGMYGIWGHDARGDDQAGEPFEIPMQGLALFACRKEAWPGFNPRFRGFGGEEGYIHEKFRQAGGQTLCLPFLRWLHRFARPQGVPYPILWEDRIRNYLIGFDELGLDIKPIKEHYNELMGEETAEIIYEEIAKEMASPFYFFDAIYCITLNTNSGRWKKMLKRFQALGIAERVRVFNAIETPDNHHIGCALSHRSVILLAKQEKLKNVLVFEDDAIFLDQTMLHLGKSISELKTQPWNIFYLGGHRWGGKFTNSAGCSYLQQPDVLTCTHALAYSNSIYDQILQDLPDTVEGMTQWVKNNSAIDQYLYRFDRIFLASPVVASQVELLPQEKKEHRDHFTLGT